jgi:hypothetical protein
VDVVQLPDGSLLVSDDAMGSTYRITYTPPPAAPRVAASRRRRAGVEPASLVGPTPDLTAATDA